MAKTVISGNTTRLWWLSFAIGIMYIVAGIVMISNPKESFYTICRIAGIPFAISGIYETYITVARRNKFDFKGWLIFSGLLDLAIGLIMILKPQMVLIPVTILISILILYQSIILMKKAFDQKTKHSMGWKWILGLAIVLMLISIVLILKPEIIGAAIAIWLGATFLIFGIYRTFLFFSLK